VPTFLFHIDPYRTEVNTEIEAAFDEGGRSFVALKDCLFYPQGGGQKGDRGFIQVNDMRIAVCDTVKDVLSSNERPILVAAAMVDKLQLGQAATATLDWSHRYMQMRLHSTVHLHHCMMEKLIGRSLPHPATSDLLDDGTAYNRYDTREVTEELVMRANAELANVIASGAAVTTSDDPEKPAFRWWHCLDYSIPCGGTHVRDIAEIGMLDVSYSQRKGRPKISFRLG
jgi:Ser-tRNA(Ala) deacylase AlaX